MNKCLNCQTEFDGNFCPKCGQRKNTDTICPKCGAFYIGNFCPRCGLYKVKTKKCPSCGTTLIETDNICKRCLHSFDYKTTTISNKPKKSFNLKLYYIILMAVVLTITILAVAISVPKMTLKIKFAETITYGQKATDIIEKFGEPDFQTSHMLKYKKNEVNLIIELVKNMENEEVVNRVILDTTSLDMEHITKKEIKNLIIVSGKIQEYSDNQNTKILLKIYYEDGSYQLTLIPNELFQNISNMYTFEKDTYHLTWSDDYGIYELDVPVQKFAFKILKKDSGYIKITGLKKEYTDEKIIYIPTDCQGSIVDELAENVFSNTNIEKIIIPKTIKKISSTTFRNCDSIKEIQIDFDNNYYDILDNCLVTKDHKTIIKAFNMPYSFKIFDSVETIGDYAFEGIKTIKAISFPSTVKTIGDYAFAECKNLASMVLNEGLIEIGGYAFLNDTSLESLNFPSSLLSIGEYAFEGSLYLKNNLKNYGNCQFFGDFDNPYLILYKKIAAGTMSVYPTTKFIYSHIFEGNTDLVNITIPDSIVSIGDYAFANCTSLVRVTMGESLKRIGKSAFSGCSMLYIIDFNEKLEYIDSLAFEMVGIGQSTDINLVFPSSLRSIGVKAFRFAHIKSVHFNDKTNWICYDEKTNTTKQPAINLLTDEETAEKLTSEYRDYIWRKTYE